MQFNPTPETQIRQPDWQPCGLLRRLLIMLYDTLVVIALMMFVTGLAMLFQRGNFTAGKDPVYTFSLLILWFLYLDWCWRHGGMTLGMRSWNVKLISDLGQPLSWIQSVSRFSCSLLSALLLGSGFIMSLFEKDKRSWHDLISRSRMIRSG